MSKITELNEKAIAVEVPEDADNFDYFEEKNDLWFELLDKNCTPIASDFISLQEGRYSILGRPEDLTEEQWKGIVERLNTFVGDNSQHIDVYVDYYKDYECQTATESGLSLLKSKGLNPVEIIILIKQ